jgi:hypothetical protein
VDGVEDATGVPKIWLQAGHPGRRFFGEVFIEFFVPFDRFPGVEDLIAITAIKKSPASPHRENTTCYR